MTRVRIRGSERLGTIEIAYANADELERLAELLGARGSASRNVAGRGASRRGRRAL